MGDDTRALGDHQQELQNARGANDKLLECRALHCIRRIKTAIRIDGRAEHSTHLQRAIEMHNLAEQGVAWGGISGSLQLVNSLEVLEAYDTQLAIAQEIGDRSAEAAACGNLGRTLLLAGHLEQAAERLDKQLAIARDLGKTAEEDRALLGLGDVFAAKIRGSRTEIRIFGDIHKAGKHREKAFALLIVHEHMHLREQFETILKVTELFPSTLHMNRYLMTDHFGDLLYQGGAEKLLQFVIQLTDERSGERPGATSVISHRISYHQHFQLLRANAYLTYARTKFVHTVHLFERGRDPMRGFQKFLVENINTKGTVGSQYCAICRAPNTPKSECLACKACGAVRYCSRDHQKRNWKHEHKCACPISRRRSRSLSKGVHRVASAV